MASVAEKRQWLVQNGYNVGTRGKLSAEHEAAFDEQTPADQPVQPQPVQAPQPV